MRMTRTTVTIPIIPGMRAVPIQASVTRTEGIQTTRMRATIPIIPVMEALPNAAIR
jgi:hypothetical protein